MIEERLVSSLSHYLTQFKQKSKQLWTFRCPVCGDSKKSKIKTRGYIYNHKSRYWYKCFNCDLSLPLERFCKEYYPEIYRRHVVDSFIQRSEPDNSVISKSEVQIEQNTFSELGLIPVTDSFIALQFLKQRKIPETAYRELWFSSDINQLISRYSPLGYTALNYVSPRIVIPVIDVNETLVGFVSRSIQNQDPIRYYNLKITNDLFIWGQRRIDFKQEVYIVEGVFDALFIPNAIATLSAVKFQQAIQWLKQQGVQTITLILDNEPRNKEIRTLLQKFIKQGERVVLLSGYQKDINDLVLQNPNIDLPMVLTAQTTWGLEAQLQVKRWMEQ